MQALKIPYAIDFETRKQIRADDLAKLDGIELSNLRHACLRERRSERGPVLRYRCPACQSRVYPKRPTNSGFRPFWSHRANQAGLCPLDDVSKLTAEEINAHIFKGRQEGTAHRELVRNLEKQALSDRRTDAKSLTIETYVKPTGELSKEFRHGRFPDLQFLYNGHRVVLEAQLAPISLQTIISRRDFYERENRRLLWITRDFDPDIMQRSFKLDIAADQLGILFSVDSETEKISKKHKIFFLRCWTHRSSECNRKWVGEIVTLTEAIWLSFQEGQRPMHIRTKLGFVRKFGSESMYVSEDNHALKQFTRQVAAIAGVEIPWQSESRKLYLNQIRLLISLEVGRVVGSGHKSLTALANASVPLETHAFFAVALVEKAIRHWSPALLHVQSVERALHQAREQLEVCGLKPWGRKSALGKIRDALFEEWSL